MAQTAGQANGAVNTGSIRAQFTILFVVISGLFAAWPAYGADWGLGVRYQRAANFIGGLQQIAVTGGSKLPFKWQPFNSARTCYILEVAGGVFLNGSPDARPFVEIGPTVRFQFSGGRGVYIGFGVSPTLIGGSDFRDNQTLGGSFFFTTHLTLGWNFSTWQLGVRYQHISNANFSSPNPGVNMFGIEARF